MAEPAWARCTVTAGADWASAGRRGEPATTRPASSAATSPRAAIQARPLRLAPAPAPAQETRAAARGRSPVGLSKAAIRRPSVASSCARRSEMDLAAALGGVGGGVEGESRGPGGGHRPPVAVQDHGFGVAGAASRTRRQARPRRGQRVELYGPTP